MRPTSKKEVPTSSGYVHPLFFDNDLSTLDPAFDAIVCQLLPEIETYMDRKYTAKGQHIAHLKLVLLNLLKADCQNRGLFVAYSRNRDHYYPQKVGKQGLKVRHDILIQIIDELEEFDYVEQVTGAHEFGFESRMRATNKLVEHFLPVREMFPPEYIILKDKDGKPIPFEETDETRQIQKNLYFINEVNVRHSITLPVNDEILAEIKKRMSQHERESDRILDLTQPILLRIFNESFEFGGRFYGAWWINLTKEYRHLIRVDGEEPRFLDFSGTVVNLIYSLCGLNIPKEDVYSVPSAPPGSREFVKLAVQMILNNPSREAARKALQGRVNKKKVVNNTGLTILQLFDALEDKHRPLVHKFYQNVWGTFQRAESDIAENILLCLTRQDIPVLPIHDCFGVRTRDISKLEEAMTRYGRGLSFKEE